MRLILILALCTLSLISAAQKKHWQCVTLLYDPQLTLKAGVETSIGFSFEDPKGKLLLTEGYAGGNVSWNKLQVRVKNASFYRGKLTLKSDILKDTITIRVNWLKYPEEVYTFYISPEISGHIQLYYKGNNGKNGKSYKEGGLRFSNGTEDGQRGEDGENGKNGKNVRATVSMKETQLQVIISSEDKTDTLLLKPGTDELTLHANGGNGGNGGDAGNGTPGKERSTSTDLNGGNGGNGGDGGNGGSAGDGGKITFIFLDEASWQYKDSFHGEALPGTSGKGGRGGRNGQGGQGGVNGRNGADGKDGKDGALGLSGQQGPAVEYSKGY